MKSFRSEKDLRLFVKKFFKENLKGLPEMAKIEIEVYSLNPPSVKLYFPFYSEGNFLRAFEVDFLLAELYNLGIKGSLFYQDDLGERELNEFSCACSQ
ncbi:hypothetical protein THC_1276 [Caldimicrobium thiodismutans]|jgi:hypothetical protein|uniref:Uncharacterized protein n=1 Tax=Caldimicrobium thiodismutans TaxID=1653476 RepID=A0A0U5AI98_9BACT|nr:hypothetical protein [Caldimicrobium thiodismutans]BAU23644.1 hypothetical protein THC_1276 [Caldimicrobium thiodismutans]